MQSEAILGSVVEGGWRSQSVLITTKVLHAKFHTMYCISYLVYVHFLSSLAQMCVQYVCDAGGILVFLFIPPKKTYVVS